MSAADAAVADRPRANGAAFVVFVARLLLGGVMIYFAAAKISNPIAFLKEVHNYGILPEQPPLLLNATAIILPYMELVLGLALILGLLRRGAGAIVAALMVVFIVALTMRAYGIYQAQGIAFCGVKFDCGCGTGEVFICRKLLENTGLLILGLIAAIARTRRFGVGGLFDGAMRTAPAPQSGA